MLSTKSRLVTPWRAALVVFALLLIIPVFTIVSSLFQPFSEAWQHLLSTVLPTYITNSLWLMLGVGVGTLILGVVSAWLVNTYDFPGRGFFEWALLLPMAMPAYILAYSYTGLLDFAGPVQSFLRDTFGWKYGDYWFPEIRSLGGAIIMLSLVLYPYVYFIVRASFMEQSRALLEVSRTLGNGPWRTFYRVALPMARPAIVAGVSLAMMESLADYGTVQYFGVTTFTTGIFRTWFGLGELTVAAQLSSVLMLFVLMLIGLERWSRLRLKYHHATPTRRLIERIPATLGIRIGAVTFCTLILSAGFILPVAQLAMWAVKYWQSSFDARFVEIAFNSFLLALLASLSCLVIASVFVYAQRLRPEWLERSSVRLASMGYAVPGTVIAVGVLIPFAWLDEVVDEFLSRQFDLSTGLLLSGTIFTLIFAYMVRFMAVSTHALETGLEKIRPSIDNAAQSMGYSAGETFLRVHLPLLKVSMVTALLLVFVDVLKELPATLILRPFNFNTLAVRAFELASDERLTDAALPSLAIVIIGLIPVYLMVRSMRSAQA